MTVLDNCSTKNSTVIESFLKRRSFDPSGVLSSAIIENVFIQVLGGGNFFTVTVTAAAINGDGVPYNSDGTDQDFALVCFNGVANGSAPVALCQDVTVPAGADCTARNREARTPLMQAAIGGNLDVARVLIERGADVRAADAFGYTALHQASNFGHLEVVELLIESGAETSVADKAGNLPIHGSMYSGDIATVRCLIARGGQPEMSSVEGRALLPRAVHNRHLALVKFLVEELGADVNGEGSGMYDRPLHEAAKYSFAITRYLLRQGADPNLTNAMNKTAAEVGAELGNRMIVYHIIEKALESEESASQVAGDHRLLRQ